MNISSHRMASSRYRDTINLASSGITKRERHLWVCSQIHSRAVFFIVQVLMILLSLTILVQSVTKSLSDRLDWGHIFIAYALFFGAVSGIWALKLVDNEHKKGSRIKKHGVIPPKFIIIPSYIVQIGLIIWFAYGTLSYLITNMSSFMEQSPLFLFFGVLIPIWIVWLVILYVFAAEISCLIYVINCSRHWHHTQYLPSLLNMRALNNERHPFESSSSRNRNCHLAMNTLHERERIKPAENFIGSKEVCNNTETKIEIMPPIHAADNMTPCFSECPRRGISIITSQLDTVPEESSKSTNSLE
uniref:Transmembrane protein n=1 Tax=Wuchereria bancrofti TaxID=6293 RepID=A0A1I8EC05_WUCBA